MAPFKWLLPPRSRSNASQQHPGPVMRSQAIPTLVLSPFRQLLRLSLQTTFKLRHQRLAAFLQCRLPTVMSLTSLSRAPALDFGRLPESV